MEVDFWSYIIQNINVCIFATCIKEASLARNPCGMFCFSLLFFSVLIHFISQLIRVQTSIFYLSSARKQPDRIHHRPERWTSISWSRLNLFQRWNVSHYWILFLSGPQRRTHIRSEESRLMTQCCCNLVLWPLSIQTQAHMILLIIYTCKHTWWAKLWLRGPAGENLQGLVPKG